MPGVSIDELIGRYPVLYHMAQDGSWDSIRQFGLLSTSAVLDLFSISGRERVRLERARRPEIVRLSADGLPEVALRDNKPLTDSDLERCLEDGLSPSEWYAMLNARVFFWLSSARLERLLSARAYRHDAHVILRLDSRRLIQDHLAKITLSPMNSGATRPMPRPRGLKTFLPLTDYPYRERIAARKEPVVELAVNGGVIDVERYTLLVERREPGLSPQTLWRPTTSTP